MDQYGVQSVAVWKFLNRIPYTLFMHPSVCSFTAFQSVLPPKRYSVVVAEPWKISFTTEFTGNAFHTSATRPIGRHSFVMRATLIVSCDIDVSRRRFWSFSFIIRQNRYKIMILIILKRNRRQYVTLGTPYVAYDMGACARLSVFVQSY